MFKIYRGIGLETLLPFCQGARIKFFFVGLFFFFTFSFCFFFIHGGLLMIRDYHRGLLIPFGKYKAGASVSKQEHSRSFSHHLCFIFLSLVSGLLLHVQSSSLSFLRSSTEKWSAKRDRRRTTTFSVAQISECRVNENPGVVKEYFSITL